MWLAATRPNHVISLSYSQSFPTLLHSPRVPDYSALPQKSLLRLSRPPKLLAPNPLLNTSTKPFASHKSHEASRILPAHHGARDTSRETRRCDSSSCQRSTVRVTTSRDLFPSTQGGATPPVSAPRNTSHLLPLEDREFLRRSKGARTCDLG